MGMKRYVTCYCGVKGKDNETRLKKEMSGEKREGDEGDVDTTECTGIEMSDGLQPHTNPNGKMYVHLGAQSPMSVSDVVDGMMANINLANQEMHYPPLPAAMSTENRALSNGTMASLDSIDNQPGTEDFALGTGMATQGGLTPIIDANMPTENAKMVDANTQDFALANAHHATNGQVQLAKAETDICESCGKEDVGKVDDEDDCFYCFTCWEKWSDLNVNKRKSVKRSTFYKGALDTPKDADI